jgi:hypothetical protein
MFSLVKIAFELKLILLAGRVAQVVECLSSKCEALS